jgi:Flp pilus assembly protein TadB
LELKLINTEYGTSTSWRGATAEIVNEFLVRHVPGDRIETDVAGERPARRIDVEKQLAKAREDCRGPWRCLLIFGPFLVALMIWTAIAESVFKASFMAVLFAIYCVPLFWFVLRKLRSRCLKLAQQLASFDGMDSGATTRTSEPESPAVQI